MITKNACVILDQLLQKLQQKLEKEHLTLEQIKTVNNPLQLLQQEQRIYLLKAKIASAKNYVHQLNTKT